MRNPRHHNRERTRCAYPQAYNIRKTMNDPILHSHDQHIIISAMRYCRDRQSYFTRATTAWVRTRWTILGERTQAQLIQDARPDIQIRAQLTPEEKAQLNQEQPAWEAYLDFIEGKINE